MSQPRPEKRQREYVQEGRVKSIPWFDDGNIILRAENMLFRVHRGILAHHSDVFRDMFAMPQPAEDENLDENVDGCPVVTLYDKAEDVQRVLSFLFDNFKKYDLRDKISFEDLAAILRLGHKYQIQHLVDEGIGRLRTEYPSTLEKWQTLCNDFKVIKENDEYLRTRLLNLAAEMNIQTVLPAMYLDQAIYDFIAGTNGTDVFSMNADVAKVSLIGHIKLIRACQKRFMEWERRANLVPAGNPHGSFNCKKNLSSFILHSPAIDFTDGIVCFTSLELKYGKTMLCSDCLHAAHAAYRQAQKELWDDLPLFYNLPRWGDLEDFKA